MNVLLLIEVERIYRCRKEFIGQSRVVCYNVIVLYIVSTKISVQYIIKGYITRIIFAAKVIAVH